jgi:hypothetical protein
MKIKNTLGLVVLGTILSLPTLVKGQAERDSKIVGTYQAVIEGQPITVPVTDVFSALGAAFSGTNTGATGTYTFFVSGVLFSFNLNFNPLGFHEGRIARAFLFLGGRKIAMNGTVLILPLDTVVGTGTNSVTISGGRKNRSANFSLNAVTVPFVAGFNAEISFEGAMEYVGAQRSQTFFKERVEYFGDKVTARVDYDILSKDLDLVNRSSIEVGGLIVEAKKVSNVSGLFDFNLSPKIYR